MKIKNVTDPEFRRYGRIVDGYDFTEMIKVMEQTPLPEEVIYVPSDNKLEKTEPAIDLGICLAIVSSAKDIVIPDNVMVFGEIGLSGEIRAVSMAGQRVQEAKKLGFETVMLPEVCKSSVGKVEGINLVYVSQIRDAISYIMRK